MTSVHLDPAGLETAARALCPVEWDPDDAQLVRIYTAQATSAVRAYLAAAPVPPDGEPRRWFVGVSADRPMEIQFTEANGPGGWVQSDDHERAVAAAFAAGRAAASPDPPDEDAIRADERERLSARVYENDWCPTCAAQPAPGGPIPGPDPGACPRCGEWRKAGMIHRCPAASPDPPDMTNMCEGESPDHKPGITPAATPDPPCAHGLTGGRGATERCFECGASVPAASPDERLREALTADAIAAAVMEWDRWPCRATTDKRPAMRAAIAAALDTAALAAADRDTTEEENDVPSA